MTLTPPTRETVGFLESIGLAISTLSSSTRTHEIFGKNLFRFKAVKCDALGSVPSYTTSLTHSAAKYDTRNVVAQIEAPPSIACV